MSLDDQSRCRARLRLSASAGLLLASACLNPLPEDPGFTGGGSQRDPAQPDGAEMSNGAPLPV